MRFIILVIILSSCTSGILKYKGEKNIAKNIDFEQKVVIKGVDAPEAESPIAAVDQTDKKQTASLEIKKQEEEKPAVQLAAPAKKNKPSKNKKAKGNVDSEVSVSPPVRQPDLEDSEGFEGAHRRPKVDPFRTGEMVTHSVSYFSAQAGIVNFIVKPYVEVNNRKSYNFLVELKSRGFFSNFYSVDDQVETFVDFEELVPHVFKLHLKESGQLKEAQSYFDQKSFKATYWENKYTEKSGHEEKKLEWDILPFSQNAYSGLFYMRIFKWDVGKEYSFRVSDDKKNIIFKGTAIKKEKLDTEAGVFDAIQVKAQIVSRGLLEQAGDILIWISDDDRKYILRIEAKIKIGTLVSEVISIKPGKAN